MSVEGQRYMPVEKIVVKKDQPYSKTEGYKNWGMTTNKPWDYFTSQNKRMSTQGNWRK